MSIENNELKHELIDLVTQLPVCNINSSETEYTTRCPYCGDSSTASHGHFAIHIDVNNDDPILYRCLKCSVSGIVNKDVLSELQLNAPIEVYDKLRNFNRKIIKKNNFIDSDTEKFTVPLSSPSTLNNLKLDYHNSRLDTNFTFSDCYDLKMVFDIYEFMKHNDIKSIIGLNEHQLDILRDNYIGWLSANNNCIIFRRIRDDVKWLKRYIKVIVNPRNINGNTFYGIPNKINMLYTNPIDIYIAEGIYDITSVYANLHNSNLDNSYYYASCGFGSITILKYLIYNGINTGLNVHIYSDNDKTDKDHLRNIIKSNNIDEWIDHIYIHRNQYEGEKDYGIPSSKIIDGKRRIK